MCGDEYNFTTIRPVIKKPGEFVGEGGYVGNNWTGGTPHLMS